MMTSAVKGRSLEETEKLIRLFSSMITIGISPEDEALEESLSLLGVHSFRARHNCALMGWQALRKVINQSSIPWSLLSPAPGILHISHRPQIGVARLCSPRVIQDHDPLGSSQREAFFHN